jgi:hypothetical protein
MAEIYLNHYPLTNAKNYSSTNCLNTYQQFKILLMNNHGLIISNNNLGTNQPNSTKLH